MAWPLMVAALCSLSSCGEQRPTTDEIRKVLAKNYGDEHSDALRIRVGRIGDRGKGDFAAPGSQDTYWPIEFTVANKAQSDPIQVGAEARGTAKIWRDKMGIWQVAHLDTAISPADRAAIMRQKEAALRQQLGASLGAAGANALPAPSFVEDEISLTASRGEWGALADKVSATAEKFGGSAAKGLTEEEFLIVMIEIPSARMAEFRQVFLAGATATPGPNSSAAPTSAPNEKTIAQVRISENGR